MYSLLVIANLKSDSPDRVLKKSAVITERLMPTLGANITQTKKILPEIDGGFFYLSPTQVNTEFLITEFSDEEYHTVFFGNLLFRENNNYAQIVTDLWQQTKNINNIRNLNGCFSAVIIDKKQKRIFVASDIVGQRSLRYFIHDDAIFISTQDVPLVATGYCPIDFDPVSASSILHFGWSLQGKSLLKNISVCDPNEYLIWQDGKLEKNWHPLLNQKNRIEENDTSAIDSHINSMIEIMQGYTTKATSSKSYVNAALTAGLDSRTIVGLLRSILPSSKIHVHCSGEEESTDVRTAKKIAKIYHLTLRHSAQKHIANETFLEHLKILAFDMNGDSNSKRALNPLPRYDHRSHPYFGGRGAGIYIKGWYYPEKFSENSGFDSILQNDVLPGFHRRMERIKYPFISEEYNQQIIERIMGSCQKLYKISPIAADLLDLFYLYERYSRWGKFNARGIWSKNNYEIFAYHKLIKMGYQLPSPIADYGITINKKIIAQHLPEIKNMPINNEKFLFMYGEKTWQKNMVKKISHKIFSNQLKIRKILKGGKGFKTIDRLRSEAFIKILSDFGRDLLLSSNSVCLQLFDKSCATAMINEYTGGKSHATYIQVFGFLLTMEEWQHQILEAKKLSEKL